MIANILASIVIWGVAAICLFQVFSECELLPKIPFIEWLIVDEPIKELKEKRIGAFFKSFFTKPFWMMLMGLAPTACSVYLRMYCFGVWC